MIVIELINELKKYPENTEVRVFNYENGNNDDISGVEYEEGSKSFIEAFPPLVIINIV
jgi:hypothetical protein